MLTPKGLTARLHRGSHPPRRTLQECCLHEPFPRIISRSQYVPSLCHPFDPPMVEHFAIHTIHVIASSASRQVRFASNQRILTACDLRISSADDAEFRTLACLRCRRLCRHNACSQIEVVVFCGFIVPLGPLSRSMARCTDSNRTVGTRHDDQKPPTVSRVVVNYLAKAQRLES